MNRVDLGMTLPDAIAAPRATQRNTPTVLAETAYRTQFGPSLAGLGHVFGPDMLEIGAATGIEFGPRGLLIAAAEPVRRGGGAAAVVRPRK